jgi:hypothetical protein
MRTVFDLVGYTFDLTLTQLWSVINDGQMLSQRTFSGSQHDSIARNLLALHNKPPLI